MSNNNKLEYEILYKLLENSSEGYLVTDKEFNIIHAFPKAIELLNIEKDGKKTNLKQYIDISNLQFFKTDIMDSSNTLKPVSIKIETYNDKVYLVTVSTGYDHIAKSRLLASTSHDLKNPIQPLSGFSQALSDGIAGELNDQQKRFINIINKNSNIIHRMLISIIDYCKIEAGTVSYSLNQCMLDDLITVIVNIVEPLTESKQIEFSYNLNNLDNTLMITDKEKLSQVLINLIENAIKYSKESYIKLEVNHPTEKELKRYALDNKKDDYLVISVTDPGKDLTQENKNSIFEETKIAIGQNNRKYGIPGLNYILSAKIVTALGGFIWLDENTDEEYTFNILLPVKSKIDE